MLLACWILLTVMICPFQVQAQEKVLASGKDGNISWKAVYDPDAVYSEQFPDGGMRILYLSGTGDMKDYEGMGTFCPGTEWAP